MNSNHEICRTGAERASAVLSERDFIRLSDFFHARCGIKLPPAKKTMLEARLGKRMKAHGIGNYALYCDYLFSNEGLELELDFAIDAVTTNKTEFFREPAHFDFLINRVIPDLVAHQGAGVRRPLMIWSAGCSTGEEPYTLAMIASEAARNYEGFRFSIVATDISTRVLETAKKAIYEKDRIAPVPDNIKRSYLMRGKNKYTGYYRVVPELRDLVNFRRLNFMDGDFGMREPIDIIFCRNVIIYFDRPTQERLLQRFCRHLVPGGYMFMGHSETLHGMNLPLVSAGPTTYRKTSGDGSEDEQKS
jgi:chemotaxis protein methyltransferase CheR